MQNRSVGTTLKLEFQPGSLHNDQLSDFRFVRAAIGPQLLFEKRGWHCRIDRAEFLSVLHIVRASPYLLPCTVTLLGNPQERSAVPKISLEFVANALRHFHLASFHRGVIMIDGGIIYASRSIGSHETVTVVFAGLG